LQPERPQPENQRSFQDGTSCGRDLLLASQRSPSLSSCFLRPRHSPPTHQQPSHDRLSARPVRARRKELKSRDQLRKSRASNTMWWTRTGRTWCRETGIYCPAGRQQWSRACVENHEAANAPPTTVVPGLMPPLPRLVLDCYHFRQ
jgi:hypothetical protein